MPICLSQPQASSTPSQLEFLVVDRFGNRISQAEIALEDESTHVRNFTLSNGAGIDVEYRYSAAQNNGKITQMKDWISGEEVNYPYDSLQRLSSATTTGPEWGLNFAYDGFGNRTSQSVTKGTAPAATAYRAWATTPTAISFRCRARRA